ncbi:MAG: M23 family metallopeptidase, partial [Oscillospiraceae bacterium]|nr:M23 family metallopeptidase [Oscillospiraceae bacterium]
EWTALQTTLTVGRLGATIAASLTSGEQAERYSAYMEGCGNRQAYGNPFDFPWLGYVSSGYGWRVHPITGVKNLHRGVDIAVAQGTAIKAIQDGRVVSAGDMGGYGLCVVIEDEKGYQSRYAHCSSLSVSAGQEVRRGDVIGAVGSTGNSTGPHLHLEVMRDGGISQPLLFCGHGRQRRRPGAGDPGLPRRSAHYGNLCGDAGRSREISWLSLRMGRQLPLHLL